MHLIIITEESVKTIEKINTRRTIGVAAILSILQQTDVGGRITAGVDTLDHTSAQTPTLLHAACCVPLVSSLEHTPIIVSVIFLSLSVRSPPRGLKEVLTGW